MEPFPADWSTQQLAEFGAFISGFVDETAAAHEAVERACEALEAEVGAFVVADRVASAVGFPAGQVPLDGLLAAVRGGTETLDVPGVGRCQVVTVLLEDGLEGAILVARSGRDPFRQEELTLLRGMARVLALSLDRMRTVEALRLSEERARQVVETAGESFIAVDLQGLVREWNRQAEVTFGWAREEIVGRPARELLMAPGAESDADALWQTLGSLPVGAPLRAESWARHRDGHRFPVELTAWPFAGRDGRRIVNAFVKDITERKRSSELQSQLAAIVQHSDDAIIGMSPDTTITSWNAGAERIYGYTAQEAIGRTIAFLTPWVSPDHRSETLLAVAQGIRKQNWETAVERKDGTRITVSVNASPIVDDAGRPVGISSVGRDITERKRFEQELAEARDQAVEAARLKSEFLANMSHEIRTPMNAVIGMTQILLDTDLSDEQRDYAETVRTSGMAMLEIIDDILDFSKIEAGKLRFVTVELTVQAVVEEVAEMLAQRAHEKRLELTTIVDPRLGGALRGDPGRLRQILLNLVGNAVKFTEKGEIALRAHLIAEEPGSADVLFEVTDTGIGIAPEDAARLFDPFYQVDASASRRHGGTGLGLAISGRLVESMGGRIGVQSSPGEGSRFWFSVRLAKGAPAARTEVPRLEGRVLVVDDSPGSREALRHQLASWGLAVDAAADGGAALAAMLDAGEGDRAAAPYAVILVDAQMAGFDGLDLVEALAAPARLAGTRVVLLVPPGTKMEAETAQRLGVAATLPKPVRQSSLLRCLTSLIGGGGMAQRREHPALPVRPDRRGVGRILVTEDNVVNQRVAVLMLHRLGFRTQVASNGAEALQALERGSFAAVLMDCQMPGVDGYEATAELRRREAGGPRTPVIAMTAGAMEGDRERCLAAGMDDYITKPVEVADLEAALLRWIPEASEQGDETRVGA